jgi:glutaredoxin-related protein
MSPGAPSVDLLANFDKHTLPTDSGRTHTIYVCPGCAEWQVEVNEPAVDRAPATARASLAALNAFVEVIDSRDAAREVADAHRTACPTLDMLAGLTSTD